MTDLTSSDSGITIPGYTDVRLIGRGGFSTVYYAVQTQFERIVAVKVLDIGLEDERTRRQYQRECAATGRLSGHPNIVSIIDSGFTSTFKPYLSMDYFSQGSLGDRVKAYGPLPVNEVLRIGVKIAGALESAHQKDILHRDIKPENILVSGYSEPGLADFGIATVTARLESSVTIHALTPNHAPPEVMEGKKATERSDVYSLGSTLYELLAGRPAFNLGNDNGILAFLLRVIQEPLPPIPRQDVVPVVHDVISAMMAKDPTSRYQSAGAVGVALQQLQAHLGYPVTELVTFVPVPGALSTSTTTTTTSSVPVPGGEFPGAGRWDAQAAVDHLEKERSRPTVPPTPTPMPVAPPDPAAQTTIGANEPNSTVLRPGAASNETPDTSAATSSAALPNASTSTPSTHVPPPPSEWSGDVTGSATVAHQRHAPAIEVADLSATQAEGAPPKALRVFAILIIVALLVAAGYFGVTRLKNNDVAVGGPSTSASSTTTDVTSSTDTTDTTDTDSSDTTDATDTDSSDTTDTTDDSGSSEDPVGPPTSVVVTVTGGDSVQVSWRDDSDGDSFYVYQVFSPEGERLSLVNQVTDGPSSQVITEVTSGALTTESQTYCVAVGTVVVGATPAWADAVCTDGSTIPVS